MIERGDRAVLFSEKIGKGSVAYFAGGLGAMMWRNDLPDYRVILERMIYPEAGDKPIKTDAPETVNVTAFRLPGGKATVHLVNATGGTPLVRASPVGPIRLILQRKNVREATWLAPGREEAKMEVRPHSGGVEIIVPKLEAYGLLLIE